MRAAGGRTRATAAMVGGAALALAACTGGGSSTPRTTTPTSSTLPIVTGGGAALPAWLVELLASAEETEFSEPPEPLSSTVEVLAACGEAGDAGAPCEPGQAARLSLREPDAIAEEISRGSMAEVTGLEFSSAVLVYELTDGLRAKDPEVDVSSVDAALRSGGMRPAGYRATVRQHGEPKGGVCLGAAREGLWSPPIGLDGRVTLCGTGAATSSRLTDGDGDPGFVVAVDNRLFAAEGSTLTEITDGSAGASITLAELQGVLHDLDRAMQGELDDADVDAAIGAFEARFPMAPPTGGEPSMGGSAFELTCDPPGTTGADCDPTEGAVGLRARLLDPEAVLADTASSAGGPFEVEGLTLSPLVVTYVLSGAAIGLGGEVDLSSVDAALRTGGLVVDSYQAVVSQHGEPIMIIGLYPDGDRLTLDTLSGGWAVPQPALSILAGVADHPEVCCVVGGSPEMAADDPYFAVGNQVVSLSGYGGAPMTLDAFGELVRDRMEEWGMGDEEDDSSPSTTYDPSVPSGDVLPDGDALPAVECVPVAVAAAPTEPAVASLPSPADPRLRWTVPGITSEVLDFDTHRVDDDEGDTVLLTAEAVLSVKMRDGSRRWEVDLPMLDPERVAAGDPVVVLAVDDGAADRDEMALDGTDPGMRPTVVALDPATGDVRWRLRYDAPVGPSSRVAVTADAVYVVFDVFDQGDVSEWVGYETWALDPKTGAMRWHRPHELLAAGDGLAVLGDDGFCGLYAVDPVSGAQRWSTPLAIGRRDAVVDTVYVTDDAVYATVAPGPEPSGRSRGHQLLRFARSDGTEAWRLPLSLSGTTSLATTIDWRTVAEVDGRLFVLDAEWTDDDDSSLHVLAVTAATGVPVWSVALPTESDASGLTYRDGRLELDLFTSLVRLDPATGKVVAAVDLGADSWSVVTPLGVLVMGEDSLALAE